MTEANFLPCACCGQKKVENGLHPRFELILCEYCVQVKEQTKHKRSKLQELCAVWNEWFPFLLSQLNDFLAACARPFFKTLLSNKD